MIGFVFLFCLLFRWGILYRMLLVVGWCWVLYSSGFLCVSSHYLILPRVSSLVVHGLGVSAPTLKDQGLILCWRLKVCDQGTWLGQVKTLFQATDLSMAPPLSEVRSWRDTPVCAADRLLGRMWQQFLLPLFFLIVVLFFSFLRILHTVLNSGSTNIHSH